MKILLINDNSTHKGGAEVSVFGTHKLLKEFGHEVYFFGFGNGKIENSLILAEKTNRLVYFLEKFFFSFRIYNNLKKYLKKIQPDVVHLHNNYLYSISVLLALKNSGCPTVHTVHDWGLLCPSSWGVYRNNLNPCSLTKGAGLKCYFDDRCLKLHHFLVAYFRNKLRFHLEKRIIKHHLPPSTALTSDLERYGFKNVSCLHHFVEFDQVERKSSNTDIILYVGALTKNKGVDFLIKAMPHIIEKVPTAKLRIVGDGIELQNLRELSKNIKQIEFVGRVSHKEVMAEYHGATLLVMPSVWLENSPFVLYECLLASLPVVGSFIGGIPDLVRDNFNGYLVRAGDPKLIAEKVIAILVDKDLQNRFSKNCKKLLHEIFSTGEYINKLLGVYQKAIIN